MAPYHKPLTEQQWILFRAQMEAVAEGNERSPRWSMNPVEVAEMMLLLMDRIDELEKRIA
jgi:hypothetical protein